MGATETFEPESVVYMIRTLRYGGTRQLFHWLVMAQFIQSNIYNCCTVISPLPLKEIKLLVVM